MEQTPKRGRGRPPGKAYPERLTVRLSSAHRAKLLKRAIADRKSEAEVARALLEAALEGVGS